MAVSGQFLLLMAIIKKIKLPNEATARDIGANSSNIIYDGDAGTTTTLNSKIQSIFTAIGDINSFEIALVNALPTENIDDHTIYFVPNSQDANTRDEYMYVGNQWEMIGSTTIDLSDYPTYDDISIVQGLTTGIPAATITVGNTSTIVYSNPKKIWYGTCNSSATTSPKVVSGISSSDFLWEKGSIVCVKFTYTNSTNPFKLMIGGVSKDVYLDGRTTSINRCFWSANSIVTFLYDGTRFEIISKSSYLDYSKTGHTHDYSKVQLNQNLTSGEEIASITIDSVTTTLYAPTPTMVTATQALTTGITIGSIDVNGTTTTFYAPDDSIITIPIEVEEFNGEYTVTLLNQGDNYNTINDAVKQGKTVVLEKDIGNNHKDLYRLSEKEADGYYVFTHHSNVGDQVESTFITFTDTGDITYEPITARDYFKMAPVARTNDYYDLDNIPPEYNYYVEVASQDGGETYELVNDDYQSLAEMIDNGANLALKYADSIYHLYEVTNSSIAFANIQPDIFTGAQNLIVFSIGSDSSILKSVTTADYVPVTIAGTFNSRSNIQSTAESITLFHKERGTISNQTSGKESQIILDNGIEISSQNTVEILTDNLIEIGPKTGAATPSLIIYPTAPGIDLNPDGNDTTHGYISGLNDINLQEPGKEDWAVNRRYVDSKFNAVTATIPSITATSGLTTGITIGAIDINGITTTFYAPEDTKVTQTDITGSTVSGRYPILLSAQTATAGTITDTSIKTDEFGFNKQHNVFIVSGNGTDENGGFYINDNSTRRNQIIMLTDVAGTSSTAGRALLQLGNQYTLDDGNGNSAGAVVLYGEGKRGVVIRTLDNSTEPFPGGNNYQYSQYLPMVDHAVLAAGVTTGVGSSTVPVYMAPTGELIACTLPTSSSYSLSMTGATITLLADNVAASTITLPIYDGTII